MFCGEKRDGSRRSEPFYLSRVALGICDETRIDTFCSVPDDQVPSLLFDSVYLKTVPCIWLSASMKVADRAAQTALQQSTSWREFIWFTHWWLLPVSTRSYDELYMLYNCVGVGVSRPLRCSHVAARPSDAVFL